MTRSATEPYFVFLPGTSGHGAFWDPVRNEMSKVDGVAIDWPGLGGNPPVAGVSSFSDLVPLVIEQIGDRQAVLVGQSMGGFVAMRVALERPDLVSHLVLAVTSAGVDRSVIGLPEWHPMVAGSAAWVAEPQEPLDDLIPQVSVPTLLLWATDDEISPLPVGERLHELLPNSELVTYQSDDHWVVLEHAKDVAARIEELVRVA